MISSESEIRGPAQRAVEGLERLVRETGRSEGLEPSGIRVAIAPGRVNLLGGHTDYNEGYVLPVAVDRFVSCAVAVDDSGTIEFHSLDFDDRFTLELARLSDFRGDREEFERLAGGRQSRWRRYVAGVILEMDEAAVPLASGLVAIAGDVPVGSGLSSSAALEAAIYTALGTGVQATPEAALLCQRAENRWAGVPCGIMDQFASLLAEQGKALFLDCRLLTYKNVSLPGQSAITVVDSGVRRELADGRYSRRRHEIETALEILRKVAGPIQSLRDLSPGDLAGMEDLLPHTLRKRVEHVVGAIERVPKGVAHLALGEVERFGQLITECHHSLARLYEVSIPELDIIVESALEVDGVFGARLTGAGFGGCCVIFHREGCEEELESAVTEAFEAGFGSGLSFHHLHAASGARLLDEAEISEISEISESSES